MVRQNERICDRYDMLIGYMRVSKADGSQATDLQRDALIAAEVDPVHLYGTRHPACARIGPA